MIYAIEGSGESKLIAMYNANNPELPNTLASLQTKTMNIFLKEFSEGSLSFIGKRA